MLIAKGNTRKSAKGNDQGSRRHGKKIGEEKAFSPDVRVIQKCPTKSKWEIGEGGGCEIKQNSGWAGHSEEGDPQFRKYYETNGFIRGKKIGKRKKGVKKKKLLDWEGSRRGATNFERVKRRLPVRLKEEHGGSRGKDKTQLMIKEIG